MLLGGFVRQFTRQPLIEYVPIMSADCRDSRVYENSIRIGRGVEIGMLKPWLNAETKAEN